MSLLKVLIPMALVGIVLLYTSFFLMLRVPDVRLQYESFLGPVLYRSCRQISNLRRPSRKEQIIEPLRVMFGANHKTGTLLAQRLAQIIAHQLNAEYIDAPSSLVPWNATRSKGRSMFVLFRHSRFLSFLVARMIEWHEGLRTLSLFSDMDSLTYKYPSKALLVEDAHVVHFVRDPVAIIISAFLWHRTADEGWNTRKDWWCTGNRGSIYNHTEYIDFPGQVNCRPGTSYQEYLNTVSEEEGLLFEAYRSKREIFPNMLQGVRIIQLSGRGLNVCLEDLESEFEDNLKMIFSESGVQSSEIRCLLDKTKFLRPGGVLTKEHTTHFKPEFKKVKQRLVAHLQRNIQLWRQLMQIRQTVGCVRS